MAQQSRYFSLWRKVESQSYQMGRVLPFWTCESCTISVKSSTDEHHVWYHRDSGMPLISCQPKIRDKATVSNIIDGKTQTIIGFFCFVFLILPNKLPIVSNRWKRHLCIGSDLAMTWKLGVVCHFRSLHGTLVGTWYLSCDVVLKTWDGLSPIAFSALHTGDRCRLCQLLV